MTLEVGGSRGPDLRKAMGGRGWWAGPAVLAAQRGCRCITTRCARPRGRPTGWFFQPTADARPDGSTGHLQRHGRDNGPEQSVFPEPSHQWQGLVTCHLPSSGWSLTPSEVRLRFLLSQGADPLFRTVDGSNSPAADVTTVAARRTAYSMLLNKGVIRVGIGIPANAEFTLATVDDPYGYASAEEALAVSSAVAQQQSGLFERGDVGRPRNLDKLLATNTVAQNQAALRLDLAHQSVDATLGHAQARSRRLQPSRKPIVDFELALFTAQTIDQRADRSR